MVDLFPPEALKRANYLIINSWLFLVQKTQEEIKKMKVSRIENTISSMSFTTAYHHWKLITRTVFLVMVIVDDFICRAHHVDYFSMDGLHTSFFAMAIWVLFMMEMVLRLLPSKLESGGCQKQFQSMYKPGHGKPVAGTAKSGRKILAMVYSVCDMICILYFCPFQTWIMKNRCCTNCYIYNWDYAMMFTPLILVRTWFSWSLIGIDNRFDRDEEQPCD